MATNEEAPSPVVPRLRFPEFRGAEGWVQLSIGQVCSSYSGGTPSTTQKTNYGGSIPFIRSAEINLSETELFLTIDGLNNSSAKLVEKGDVLVALYGANSGDVGLSQINGAINQAILCLRSESSNAFIYQFLIHRKTWIVATYLQGGQGNLSGDIVKSILLGFPELAEQKKIADCLSSVDELITTQARKLDALKNYKKGLMQQLFPREGETVPRLRFPEFQGAGEWVQKSVRDVAEVLMCKRIFSEETNPTVGVPFYKIGTLGGDPDAFISREKFEDYKARYNFPRKGEVLITCSGTVGRCLPYDGKDAYFQDSNIVWLDNLKGEVSNEFLLILLTNVNWSRLNSTTITRIYGPDLRGLEIKFPKEHKEQQRISNCLTTLDGLINAETQKLEALKTHKKGLMQQLFPSVEEVARA